MALTEVPIELSSAPGIVDNSTGTAITIDASGNVGIGTDSLLAAGSSYTVVDIGSASTASLLNMTDNGTETGRIVAESNQLHFSSGTASGFIGFRTGGFSAADEAMRIASSGIVMVGKTSTGLGNAGVEFDPTGQLKGTAANVVVGYFNRTSSDGSILEFRKDNTAVGSIGADNASINIGTGNTGLLFYNTATAIYPRTTAGAQSNGAIDLGGASDRFKDLYLSGKTYLNTSSGAQLVLQTDATRGFIGTSTSHDLVLETAGTERMRIDSSGNVGIGVSPATTLDVRTSTGSDSVIRVGSSSSIGINVNVGAIEFYSADVDDAGVKASIANFVTGNQGPSGSVDGNLVFSTTDSDGGGDDSPTERMRIDSSGNVLVGRTSRLANQTESISSDTVMSVHGVLASHQTDCGVMQYVGDAMQIRAYGATAGTGNIQFKVGGGGGSADFEAARIDASGNLLVATTVSAPNGAEGVKIIPDFHGANKSWTAISTAGFQTETCLSIYSTAVTAYRFYVDAAGTISAVNTTITSLSDERVKENIRDLDDGLAKVMQLQPRKFDWKEGHGKDISNDRGFIAQEFEQVFPDMIEEWKDKAPEGEEPYKAVNANLIPTLVKAIQEQQDLIESLTARIAALEGAN